MKRLPVTAALALLCVAGLSACGSDDAVLTIDQSVVLDQADMDELLQGFSDDADWLTAQQGRCQGGNIASGSLVVPALNNLVISEALRDEIDRIDEERDDFQRLETAEDLTAGEITDQERGLQLLIQGFAIPLQPAGPEPTMEEMTAAVEDYVPARYREVLVGFATEASALQRYITLIVGSGEAGTEDVNEAQAAFLERILDDADVEVSSRYGEWDASINQVVGPDGPVTDDPDDLPCA